MRYGSVCSGIEAATQAWHPLGWQPVFFSEIDKFPSAVLAHHYGSNMPGEPLAKNGIPNYGDFTTIGADAGPVDLLVGGTPCQSFSVAGKRLGLDDPRGNLALEYLALARRLRARWIVWENVPGVLSSHTDDEQDEEVEDAEGLESADFATFLSFVQECGYGFAYRVLDAQYIRVDDFARAVPQRRRRVFLVGYLGDWRRAAAVLLEPEGMRGDSSPRREAGKRVAPTIASRPTGGGGLGTDFDLDGGLITSTGNVAHCLNAGGMGRIDYETETMVAHPLTLAIRGRDGEPDIEWRQDGTANAILTPSGGRAGVGAGAIAFDTTQITSKANISNPKPGDPCHPLAAGAHAPAIAFDWYASQSQSLPIDDGICPPLKTTMQPAVQQAWAVRRLTPRECERLQGFPDDFTNVPYRGKPAADGPRYKALGNSMACNAMRWIGQRIDIMENLIKAGRIAA